MGYLKDERGISRNSLFQTSAALLPPGKLPSQYVEILRMQPANRCRDSPGIRPQSAGVK